MMFDHYPSAMQPPRAQRAHRRHIDLAQAIDQIQDPDPHDNPSIDHGSCFHDDTDTLTIDHNSERRPDSDLDLNQDQPDDKTTANTPRHRPHTQARSRAAG